MGEKALGWGLRLLEVALLLGPILIAFAAHGWDYRAVVMLSPNPLEKLRFEAPQARAETPKKVNEYVWEMPVSITSPFDFVFTFENYSGEIFCVQAGDNVRVGFLYLKRRAEFQPRATGDITVVMEFTRNGYAHLRGHGAYVEIELRYITEVKFFGISVTSPPATQKMTIWVS